MSAGRLTLFTCLVLALVLVYTNLNASDRIEFVGRVLHKGAPLKTGLVILHPEEGTVGQIISAHVENGEFHLDQDTGPLPGEYRVEVYRRTVNSMIDESFPKEFNEASKLKLIIPSDTRLFAEFKL